jgi:hypothetical protein
MAGKAWRTFHMCATFVWGFLAIPTVLVWENSIRWVAMMSVWANVVGHWSAYQSSRAEEKVEDNGEGQ